MTIPCNCETFASQKEPVRGLYIDIDMGQLRDLIGQMDLQPDMGNNSKKTLPCGIGPATMDEDMRGAVQRLLKCLQSETESANSGAWSGKRDIIPGSLWNSSSNSILSGHA